MFRLIFKYLCSVLLIILSVPFLVLVLPVYVIRFLVGSVLIRFYPDVDKLLTTTSSVLGSDYLYTNPKASLLGVFIAEGTVNLESFRNLFRSRILEQKYPDGRLMKPEFQQYVTTFTGFFAWKWETHFDLNFHFGMYEGKYKHQLLNGSMPVNSESILDVGNELLNKAYCPETSPWHVHVIHNYRETDPVSGAPVGPVSTALILQMHHCMADGFSIMKAFSRDLSAAKELNTALPNYHRPTSGSIGTKICRSIDFVLSAPYELLTEVLSAKDVNSWHVPAEQLTRVMNGAISQQIPIGYFKEIKNLYNVTFTAVLIECFTAATRKFMMEAGFSVPDTIHCGTPLPVPGHPDKMRNHLTVGLTSLPVGLTDSKKRLEAIEQGLKDLKRSTFPTAAFKIMPLAGGLFSWMLRYLVKNNLVTAMMSNFPGPNDPFMIDSNEVVSMSFGGGFHEGNCGMGFSSLSYNGTIRITVGIDEGIVSSKVLPAKKLIQYFLDEVEILKKEAMV